MVKRPSVTERVGGNGSNVLRVGTLLLKTSIAVEGKKLLKMQNWRRAIFIEDSYHTQEDLSESLDGYQWANNFKTPETVGNDWKRRILVLHELKPRRDVERRLFTCEQILKEFLHRIVTGYIKITLAQVQKIMGIARWSYCYVDEYPWLKSHSLRLVVGPAWYVVLSDFHLTHLAQWHTAWLTSTSARMKKCKIGSTHGFYQKIKIYSPRNSPVAREMGQSDS
nr:Mariner Mos1 transposase [Hymenolepis microstoma]